MRLSPSGKRVAVTARGEILTVPTDQGSTRNISGSAAVRDYTDIWSQDGTSIAYIADDGSTQTLVIEDQSGTRHARRIALGERFNRLVDWGGDGKTLFYSDSHLQLHAMDVATGTSWVVATSPRRNGGFGSTEATAALSPKGRWLAYTKFNAALHLHDLATQKAYPVSGAFADVGSPGQGRAVPRQWCRCPTTASGAAGAGSRTTAAMWTG